MKVYYGYVLIHCLHTVRSPYEVYAAFVIIMVDERKNKIEFTCKQTLIFVPSHII